MRQRHSTQNVILLKKVKILLVERGWDQQTLAEEVGCTQSAISRVLTGQRPYSRLPHRIAEALGVALDHFLLPVSYVPAQEQDHTTDATA